jgi:hypothetical protein
MAKGRKGGIFIIFQPGVEGKAGASEVTTG